MHLAGLPRIVPHKVLRQPLALIRDAPLPIGARPCKKPPTRQLEEIGRRWATATRIARSCVRHRGRDAPGPAQPYTAGTHPKIVQEMLGHATISITLDTYSHVLPNMQEKAVEAMDCPLEGS